MMTTAVYPGTFDPMTNGHADIVRRASLIFDEVIVGVAESRKKHPLLSFEERVRVAREICAPYKNVKVLGFTGLLKDFAEGHGARVIVRGARAVSDFEYEFQMAGMNRRLMPGIETIFMMPSEQYQFVSGTFIREIAEMSAKDALPFVAPCAAEALARAVAAKKAER
ncbi:MAG: Phosphopantetheine adenylyltransferase [Burkholderia sp.]|jgi:pantetheine-phosphate adenylyltransferase